MKFKDQTTEARDRNQNNQLTVKTVDLVAELTFPGKLGPEK